MTLDTLRALPSALRRLARACVGRDHLQRVQISVPRERHGSDYGGWWVHPDPLGPASVVYSFGVGDDVTFDLSLIRRFGLRVHAFDPTPRSVDWVSRQALPKRFEFHEIGLADFDGEATFLPPALASHVSYAMDATRRAPTGTDVPPIRARVRRLTTIMALLGHRTIDLLKMDIEGAEYAVVPDVVGSGVSPGQILVEFHHGHRGHTGRQTRDAIRHLASAGYRIFAISRSGREYSFLRRP